MSAFPAFPINGPSFDGPDAVPGSDGLVPSWNTDGTFAGWVAAASVDLTPYLTRDGSRTLTADWDTGGSRQVTNLPAPSGDTDAARKSYVDAGDDAIFVSAQAFTQTYVTSALSGYYTEAEADGLLAAKADLVGGKVPTSQIPDVALTEFLGTAANQAAMLALAGQRGDWCIRSDDSKVYVLKTDDPTQAANWQALSYPGAPVTSVNSQTGTVVLGYADVGAAAASHTHAAADITSGTLADARLSSNVPLKNAANTFSALQTFSASIALQTDGQVSTAGGKLVLAPSTGELWFGAGGAAGMRSAKVLGFDSAGQIVWTTAANNFYSGTTDARIYRSAAKSITADDGAGGALTTFTVVGTLTGGYVSMSGWWAMTQAATGGISFGSGHGIRWGSGTTNVPAAGTRSGDVGLQRAAAGVLQVEDGSGNRASLRAKALDFNYSYANPVVHAYAAGDATSKSIDWSAGNSQLLASRTGNTVVAFTNATEDQPLTLYHQQDATGGRTITFSDTIRWVGGTPTIGTTASKIQVFAFRRIPNGLGYLGTYLGEA